MKKNLKLSFSVVFLGILISCNGKQAKIEAYEAEITQLKEELSIEKSNNNALKIDNKTLKRHSKILEDNQSFVDNNFCVSKSVADSFLDGQLKFILDKKKFTDKTIELSRFREDSFFQVYNNFFYFTYFGETETVNSELDFLHYLMHKFDRSSANIRSFFDKKIVGYIAEQIERSGVYRKSGLQPRIKNLLATYEDSETNADYFLNLYTKFSSKEWSWDEEYLLALPSEAIKTSITEFYEEEIDAQKVFDSYGFWARRFHEGNAETVYTILKEFDNNIEGEG